MLAICAEPHFDLDSTKSCIRNRLYSSASIRLNARSTHRFAQAGSLYATQDLRQNAAGATGKPSIRGQLHCVAAKPSFDPQMSPATTSPIESVFGNTVGARSVRSTTIWSYM